MLDSRSRTGRWWLSPFCIVSLFVWLSSYFYNQNTDVYDREYPIG